MSTLTTSVRKSVAGHWLVAAIAAAVLIAALVTSLVVAASGSSSGSSKSSNSGISLRDNSNCRPTQSLMQHEAC